MKKKASSYGGGAPDDPTGSTASVSAIKTRNHDGRGSTRSPRVACFRRARSAMSRAFVLALLLVVTPRVVQAHQSSQTPTPRITDLLTEQEKQSSGLSRLSPNELAALNAALFRVLLQLQSLPGSPSSQEQSSDDTELYDSVGRAVAYIAPDGDSTIYLWSGKPVAYLEEDSVYGFNGKHLGWFRKGTIYDHDGNPVAAVPENFRVAVQLPPLKSLKELRPLKGLRELKPLRPIFGTTWSEMPARVFFLQGAE